MSESFNTQSASPASGERSLTRFVGRQQEVAAVKQLLSRTRVLTLTGVGGVGKTRLAMRIAAEVAGDFPDGVFWVELAALHDAALVPQALAKSLDLRESPKQSLADTLAHYLLSKHLLLVLDNCEHLLSAVTPLGQHLLRTAPDVRMLATSRQPLGMSGETAWLVPSLSLPPLESNVPSSMSNVVGDIGRSDAVQLFLERASAILPEFTLTAQNAAAIVQICRRLDGLPLAIELAAARVKVLTVEQIAARLDDAFGLLTGGNRLALIPRHQTLRAAMDWSYDLLSADEQQLFRRLAVFAGGFTLEAAEYVCARMRVGEPGGSLPDPHTPLLDLLSDLVDKSLVISETLGRSEARYHLLETIRQYALEQLEASEELNTLRARHLDWYLALAERAAAELSGAEQVAWLARLEQEHDNLSAALRWAQARGGDELALRLALALSGFWDSRGYLSEGRERWVELLGRIEKMEADLRIKALNAAAWLAWRQDDNDTAGALFEQSQALARTAGAPHALARALAGLGEVARSRSNYPVALGYFEESLALYRALEDKRAVANTLKNLGNVAWEQGNFAAARSHYHSGLAIQRELADESGIAVTLFNLGGIAMAQGDYAAARPLLAESLALGRALGNKRMIAFALRSLGTVALKQGDAAAARAPSEESVALFRELGEKINLAFSLHNLASVIQRQGDPATAAALVREALFLLQQPGYKRGIWICLDHLAQLAYALGQLLRSAHLFGAAEALRDSVNVPLEPSERAERERMISAMRSTLGRDAFAAAWADGRALTLDAAMSYAREIAASPVSTVALRMMAFGEARVQRGDHLLTSADWKYAKAKELCFFLLCHSSATKEEIGLALWPDASPAQLRSLFHRTLHHLRRALGRPDWIVLDDERYVFNRALAYWFDVEAFEQQIADSRWLIEKQPDRAVAISHLQSAISLYQGDFLIDLPTGDWVMLRREALSKLYVNALMELGQLLFTAARYADAASIYQQAIARDNYLEAAHREWMRCLARQGERNQALRHYQSLVKLLRDELGVAPAPETAALYERLRRGERI